MWCDPFTNRDCDANNNPKSDSIAFPKLQPNPRCLRDTYLNTDGECDTDSDSSCAGRQPLDSDASSDRR